MAICVNSCLRLSCSVPTPAPPSPKPVITVPAGHRRQLFQKSAAVAAAATVLMIGATTAVLIPAEAGGAEVASAVRWSEKRKCPPWHVNSLENIVPENLPRPPPGRRPDGLAAFGKAPAVAGGAPVRSYNGGCYSL
uniref:Uncharacterized protein n=1 Tax=Apostasia odorata TaxID=280455 RepID=A0A1S6YFU5_9ASPA|nr:hypothetical protein [Apostasia odorata]